MSCSKIKMKSIKFSIALIFMLLALFATVTIAHQHQCMCGRDFRPVCGSNGQTYPNLCELNCAADSELGRSLDLVYMRDGTC